MVDVHCHLNFHSFKKDYESVIENALKLGITNIINVGTSLESSLHAVELSQKHKELFAIVGIHPHHADKLENNWLEKLTKIAKNNKVVGIGEIGLDYYSYKSNGIVDPKLQKEVFETQIKMAFDLKLPLQIHNRHAGEDVVKILKKNKRFLLSPPGMFHCFASTLEVQKEILEMGFFIGFDGNITYKGLAKGETVKLSKLCELTPLDRIVTETDSPFLTPEPHRGSRNEPSHVIIVGRKIAEIKGKKFEEIEKITTDNTQKLFNLKSIR